MAFEKDEYFEETFSDQEIAGGNHSEKVFERCTFRNCLFEKTVLKNCTIENCTFIACSITLPDVGNTIFDRVDFEACKIAGLHFGTLNSFCSSFNIRNSKLISCIFSGLDMRNTSFAGSMIQDSSFMKCNLTGAGFEGVQFQATRFISNDLSRATFKDATGFSINPCQNKLKGAKFSPSSALELLRPFDIKFI